MNGTIRAITPREGVVLVQEGSEVKKGDLLVSGQVPVRNDQQEVTGYQYHQTDAQILAEVSTSYQMCIRDSYNPLRTISEEPDYHERCRDMI